MDTLRMLTWPSTIRWARKAQYWAEAPLISNSVVLQEIRMYLAEGSLPVYDSFEPRPTTGWRESESRPRFFVAQRPNGARFLVNTEGAAYARYIARLPEVLDAQ